MSKKKRRGEWRGADLEVGGDLGGGLVDVAEPVEAVVGEGDAS